VAALHGAVLHGVEHLQAGDDLTRGEDLDLELVAGGRGDALGHLLGRAVDGVERLGEARGEAPLDLRGSLREAGAEPAARMPAIPARRC
jgi:hypothetical protein